MKRLLNFFSIAAILDLVGLETKSSASRRAVTYTSLVVGGAVVGAGVALMLAPKSGRELRGDVRERAHELGQRLSDSRAVRGAKQKLAQIKSNVAEAAEEANGIPQHV